MLLFALSWVVSLAAAQTSSGLLLNTTQCEDLFDFDVNSTLLAQTEANLYSLDLSIQSYFVIIPMWVTDECARSLRTIQCMSVFSPELDFSYCKSDCDAMLTSCSSLVSLLEAASPSMALTLTSSCNSFADASGCESGGTMVVYEEDEPICPYPMEVDTTSRPLATGDRVLSVAGTGCALPCKPTPVPYTDERWVNFRTMQLTCVLLSFVSLPIVFYTHFNRKKWLNNLIPAFVGSYIPAAFFALFYLVADWEGDLTCADDGLTFHVKTPFVLLTAFVLNLGFMSASYWTLCISIQLYLMVARGVTQVEMKKYLQWMWGMSLVMPCTFGVVGLAEGYFGTTYEFPFGIPWMNSDLSDPSMSITALFTYPIIALSTLALFFMALSVRSVMRVLSAMEDKKIERETMTVTTLQREDLSTSEEKDAVESDDEKVKRNWKRMLEYNQKSLMFILLICIGNIAASAIITQLYSVKYSESINDVEDYFACLLGQFVAPSLTYEQKRMYGWQQCGPIDEAVDLWDQFYYGVLWQELVGLFPLLVYGTKGKFKQAWSRVASTITRSVCYVFSLYHHHHHVVVVFHSRPYRPTHRVETHPRHLLATTRAVKNPGKEVLLHRCR